MFEYAIGTGVNGSSLNENHGDVYNNCTINQFWASTNENMMETDIYMNTGTHFVRHPSDHPTKYLGYQRISRQKRFPFLFKSLPRIPGAKHDRGRGYCDGIREEVVEEIIRWCKDTEYKSKVLWLCGQAGTGKSTISASIARILDEVLWLGVSFFFFVFSRDVDL